MNLITLNIKIVSDTLSNASTTALNKAQLVTGPEYVLSIFSTSINFLPDDVIEFNFSITATQETADTNAVQLPHLGIRGPREIPLQAQPQQQPVTNVPEEFKNAGLEKMYLEQQEIMKQRQQNIIERRKGNG